MKRLLWLFGGIVLGLLVLWAEQGRAQVKMCGDPQPCEALFMPQTLNVHGLVFTVAVVPHPGNQPHWTWSGWTMCHERRIELSEKLMREGPVWKQHQTLTHEYLHAWTCKNGKVRNLYFNAESAKEHEDAYNQIAYAMDSLIADNPEMVAWLRMK